MGAIVKELKEKIVAAGGDTTGVQTVSEALDKIPASGGSSGAGGLRLYPTYDSETDVTTLDKTAKEIADAFDAHGNVYLIEESSIDSSLIYNKFIICAYETNGIWYEFTALQTYNSDRVVFEAETPATYPHADEGK